MFAPLGLLHYETGIVPEIFTNYHYDEQFSELAPTLFK